MTEFLIIIFSILGSVGTYYFVVKYKKSPILASALLSLVVSCALFALQGSIGESLSKTLSLAFFGGSFAGMSAEAVMKKMKYAVLSGLVFGLVYISTGSFFVGYGGGLGLRASVSVFITLGIQALTRKL